MNNEFARRRGLISGGLEHRHLDAMLVSSPASVRYLSGFTGSSGMLLSLPGETVFFTDPRYAIQSGREVSCRVRVCKGPMLAAIAQTAVRHRVRRLGFERAHLSYDGFDTLRCKLPVGASLEPVSGWLEAHRMVKSAEEIALIRRSVEVNSKAFEWAARRARAGMREQDLAAGIEHVMRRLGAEKPSFDTIVAAGERSALPHAHPTQAALKTGQFLLIDMGAFVDGYASDMTRMLFLGRPGARAKRLYRAVLEAQLAAIDAVRPGVTTAHVDRQARRVLRRFGLDRAFVHSTGHGLGLEIHELPRIGRKDKTPLAAGMAITIEPGAYLEGFGGVRIEDTVVVTAGGCEVLTPTSKELRVL
ncbi:MAG TPA: Xaa-Pro peptidase family protein [Bryobacteraceae bacterium]|nr:Xaa-Pro peptidase family protein [Bryobacteraceae bacterium]